MQTIQLDFSEEMSSVNILGESLSTQLWIYLVFFEKNVDDGEIFSEVIALDLRGDVLEPGVQ